MLILDEIQTGLGRTGKLLAEEHDGIEADVTVIGKALSGGFYPISAVLSNKDVLGVLMPGDHGSTFGGNPLACAVARTALQVLVEEDLIENAKQMGGYFMDQLKGTGSPAGRYAADIPYDRPLCIEIGRPYKEHPPFAKFCSDRFHNLLINVSGKNPLHGRRADSGISGEDCNNVMFSDEVVS